MAKKSKVEEKLSRSKKIEIDGQEIYIYKIKVKNIAKTTSVIKAVMEQYDMLAEKEGDGDALGISIDVATLVEYNCDKIFSLVADMCSLSLEEVEDLAVEDAIDLVSEIIEINKDFFFKKVAPLIGQRSPSPSLRKEEKEAST